MSAIIVKSFVGQAERYFEKELTNERETYYSEKETRAGQWTGKGAEALGLKGEIKKEDFSRMSRGINPNTGKRFRRMTLGRTREVNGEVKQVKEIAGWDMVISAPKSVSIAGLIGQDERVRAAHEESVTDALERAERQAQSNNGGGKKEQTSNLVVGRFSHDSARPSQDGFVAPQLHDHCFIMNATFRADGTLKPLESLELHKAQNYIKSVYYTGLAERLQKLGYAVEIERETGAPEITGISKEYRQACSPRRAEILELAEKAGKNFRQLGLVNRREKIFDKDLIQEQHRGIDENFDFQAERVVESAKENPRPAGENAASEKEAKEAVTFALAKLSERESVFNPRVVLLEANKRGIGQTSVAAIEAELETRKKDGQVKTVSLRDGREAAFLSSDAQIEAELPHHIKAVQPTNTLLNEILKTKIPDSVKADDETEFRKLSDEQQRAVKEIMRATTGVTTLEGRAGVGKTTTLSYVNKMAKKAEYEVLGLAPTTGAAQELNNAKITSATLQKLLASQDAPRDHKRFFIVDESSFVSSRQMDKFFREAVKTGDRVLLVGDTRQHEGVEAGKPFARIQRDELTSGAKVETIRRQTKESDRETVKKLSEGRIIEAIAEMRQRGQVREVKDQAERHNSIVKAFIGESAKSMVVATRNADRQEINSKIHTALKDAGKVGREETEIKILRPRNDISGVEREFAAAYREGDVISYTRGSTENKIPAKSLAKVVKTNREENLLTVEIKDARTGTEAREITYNPKRLRGVSVWTEEKIKVSEGDRLQLRAPFEEKKTKIANGTMFEVGKITPESLTLMTDKGKAVKLDTSQPHAIDYGYAVTSHSSQGKTIDRVLIHAETGESKQILNERMAYVAVSRARDESLIFTDDAEKLAGKMARQIEKTEITQAKAETIEHAPERAGKVFSDVKPEVEKAARSEIKTPVIVPPVEKLPTPEIKIQPAQEQTIAADVKPEVARVEQREEIEQFIILPAAEKLPTPAIEIEPARKETVVLDAKPEVERGEIKQPVILPEVPILPAAEIKAPPQQQKTADSASDAKYSQETLIKEVLQISRDSLAKQGINPNPQAWKRFANAVISDSPNRKPSENQDRILESLQRDAPQPERVSFAGKTSLEATHAILTSAPEKRRDEIVKATLARYEKEVAAERGEIKQPVILASAQTLPTPEIKPQQLGKKTADSTGEAKNRRDILIKEVLQMSLDSLAEQRIEPNAEVWKRFAIDIINNWANQKSTEGHQRALESLQKDAPQSGRVDSAGESRLEAAHAMLKLATDEQRDEIVKNTLANYERQIKTERGEAVAKPEVKETAETTSLKTTSFEKAEKAAGQRVKPTPKVRDLEVVEREELISELVAAARDEARAWTGEDLSYRHEKRLTKMYREAADFKPQAKQINDLKAIEERLSEPLPQPKTFLEATILKFDNITGAEKSAALRGQITSLNEVVKREEAGKAEEAEKVEKAGTLKTFGQTESNDAFGRKDKYFTRESYRIGIKPQGKEVNNENSAAIGDGRKNHAAIGGEAEPAADAAGVIRTNGESLPGETNGADRKSIDGEGEIRINSAVDSLQSDAEVSEKSQDSTRSEKLAELVINSAEENPRAEVTGNQDSFDKRVDARNKTEYLKVSSVSTAAPEAQMLAGETLPEAAKKNSSLTVEDWAILKAQIIVREAELADLKFDEALLKRDTRIKRFNVFIEPADGKEVSRAAAPKTIDRIEFLRLASTGESLSSLKADEQDTAKWSMTDTNSAREVITDTRDFIKAEKNSRDENKWRSQQNLKNLFESHFSPLKMAENHLNTLTPDGLANHLKVQANPLAAIENHPIVQVIRSVREMKTAGAQAALLNRIDDELNQKLDTLNTHITNEVVDRIEEARDAGKSAVSDKQKEIDELKELTKDAPDAVKPDFTSEELDKISASALRTGDRKLMFEYQKAVVENAKRLEADKLRFSEKYNEMYKKDRVDKFSARAMREMENTPVSEKQAAALVEKGGQYPKNMLDALHQVAEIKGGDYVKILADTHRAVGRRDFPPVETFDRTDVLAHAEGQKLVAELRVKELESQWQGARQADAQIQAVKVNETVNETVSQGQAQQANSAIENARQMADYLGKLSADFRSSLIKEGMNANVAPVVSRSESELVKFDDIKENVGVYDKPQTANGIEAATVKTADIHQGATDAAAQQHVADAAKRELQERAVSASRAAAVQAESVDDSIGLDF